MTFRTTHPDAIPSKLSKTNVPPSLHQLIPLAEQYGIADDGYRAELLVSLNPDERAELVDAVQKFDDEFDKWLAGPEASKISFSDEYIAFSALRMLTDEA